MAETAARGTVTPFAAMFPGEGAQKAVKRVEETIAEKQKEVDRLKSFIADNTNLINLVSKLPDELHHDIMVPFGKAAFFPGRLVHTNEFMVLLGEGYYVERTAKQTVEILKRRGKELDSQVDSLKANMEDLKAEASFFGATASEAVEGLVEIREDYVEDNTSEEPSESDEKKVTVGDDEYARLMSRLDELEKEELEAEGDNDSHNDEGTNTAESKNDEDEQTKVSESDTDSPKYTQTEARLEVKEPRQLMKDGSTSSEAIAHQYLHQLKIKDQSNCTGLTMQPVPKAQPSSSRNLTGKVMNSFPAEKAFIVPEVKEKVEGTSLARNELLMHTGRSGYDSSKAFTASIVERNIDTSSQQQTVTSPQTSRQQFDSSRAFTGSIVERTNNLQTTSMEQASTSSQSSQSSNSQPSKPVSRFKMQRR